MDCFIQLLLLQFKYIKLCLSGICVCGRILISYYFYAKCCNPALIMIWLLLICFIPGGFNQNPLIGTALFSVPACEDYKIRATYESPLPERQNQYNLDIPLPDGARNMIVKFGSEVSVTINKPNPSKVRFRKLIRPRNSFSFGFYEEIPYPNLDLQVFGPARTDNIPYVLSIILDDREICKNPRIGYFDKVVEDDSENTNPIDEKNSIDLSCGRRKVIHTELIIHGQPTKSGDFPWHVAILRKERSYFTYICGGTLLSKTLVLTAAHCASIRGNAVVPDSLSVDLGKHNLIGGDIAPQERGVFEIIIYPKFNANTQNNDIALLKLKSEAVFTDYVQPACLWPSNTELPTENVFGTVAGWGFSHLDALSPTLQQITIPIISELDCLKNNPIFYQKKLNTNKFCAGFANGTSVCNGDSGGGLMVFVPDTPGDTDRTFGSWYVRGIVSLAPSRSDANICDPYQYTIFTDVEKYRSWLSEYLN